jgi:tRNA1(Val) A37 N6-methylase TrmN6
MKDSTAGTLLGGRVSYRQFAAGHRSGFEPVFLAAAVPAQAGERVLEAGTGAGAALLCLAARVAVQGVGLELNPDLAALAAQNFAGNGFADLSAVQADVLGYRTAQKFDHAMANPPWHEAASTPSPDQARALAHQAGPDLLAGWVAALARALKPRGSLTLILPAASLPAACACLVDQKFGGAKICPLWPRAGKPAGQVIVQGIKGARTPAQILPGLIVHDEGGITAEADKVLKEARLLF